MYVERSEIKPHKVYRVVTPRSARVWTPGSLILLKILQSSIIESFKSTVCIHEEEEAMFKKVSSPNETGFSTDIEAKNGIFQKRSKAH